MSTLYRAGTCALVVFITMAAFAPSVTFAAANDTSDGCPQSSTMTTGADGKQQCIDSTGSAVPGVSTNSSSDSECYFGITGMHFSFNGCIWIPLMSWLGSWFLTVGGAFLRLAGTLFDMLIQHVIIDFKSTLDTLHITDSIAVGWTIFRDFSNIVIIGIFVFIAISTILGLKEFGAKKLLANVLVVAVLMNFSLLFTKIIIDGSNFVAYQIYKQMAGPGTTVNFDIAQSFLKPMGITSVWDSTALVTKQVGQTTNSGLQAFLFGLVGGIMLLAVAGVLFYGCFLIMSRAILFIFLMLTAALAFATYLLPSLANGEYGWSSWWKTLINNAIFAPLLMLLLAVSLSIMNQAGKLTSVPLGKIIVDPAQQLSGTGWTAILIYIIGIGLLFVSFKMASGFANTISGFGLSSMLTTLPIFGGGALAAPLLRQTAGRIFNNKKGDYESQAKQAREGAAKQRFNRDIHLQNKDYGKAARADNEAKRLEHLATAHAVSAAKAGKIADMKFNVNDTAAAKAIKKELGIAGLSGESGKNTKSYAGQVKETAEHAAKIAAPLALSGEDRDKLRKDAEANARASRDEMAENRRATHETASEIKKAVEQATGGQRTTLVNEHQAAQKAMREAEFRGQQANILQAQKQVVLKQQELNSFDAKKFTVSLNNGAKVETSYKGATDTLTAAKKELDDFKKETAATVKKAGDDMVRSAAETTADIAAEIGRHEAGFFGAITGTDEVVAKEARKKFKGNIGKDSIKKALEDYVEKDAGGGTAHTDTSKATH